MSLTPKAKQVLKIVPRLDGSLTLSINKIVLALISFSSKYFTKAISSLEFFKLDKLSFNFLFM